MHLPITECHGRNTGLLERKISIYNRVLLPEYVNDKLSWDKLQKFQAGEFEELNVKLNLETEIVEINRAQKYVVDKHGQTASLRQIDSRYGNAGHIFQKMHLLTCQGYSPCVRATMLIHLKTFWNPKDMYLSLAEDFWDWN